MPPLIKNNDKRKYICFICAKVFETYPDFKHHVIESHEQGREYILCPLPHCHCPVRDLRHHYRAKHKFNKLPQDRQLRATVFYDVKDPSKRRKIPNFETGYHVSPKNNKPCHYRSRYEKEVYESLDKIGEVIRYSVEPFSIPYYFKGKERNYFPDLLVEFSDGRVEIWEIKPVSQKIIDQNQAKWHFCEQHCKLRGWKFEVITEQNIKELKNRAKG